MDKEQARFVLRSFRPDGADVGDPDFAEALTLAMANRELGEWLASERAFDAGFANALGTVNLPENLREDILACLAAERGDFPQAEDGNDAAWIGALATIHPPAALRAEVIAAMDRTGRKEASPANISIFRRLAIPLAAVAGIVLAFFLTRPAPPTTAVVNPQGVPIRVVEEKVVRTFESPTLALEEKHGDRKVLVRHLKERQLPCPGKLPRGLKNLTGIGCRELVIDGKRGSLVCFKVSGNGVVHVVIFRRADVSGELPPLERREISQDGKWATARWTDGDKVFLVMSETQLNKLKELF